MVRQGSKKTVAWRNPVPKGVKKLVFLRVNQYLFEMYVKTEVIITKRKIIG